MAKQTYIISGVIKDNSQKGISNLRVEAWDKDLLIDDFVGEATTDKNGKFKISFTEKRFRELFLDRKPDIYFKVSLCFCSLTMNKGFKSKLICYYTESCLSCKK